MPPDLSMELEFAGVVCGIDEVGRGPLCGDVVAAVVVIPDPALLDGPLVGVNDSKKLSTRRREALDVAIREHCIFAVGSASAAEIDEINILRATHLAMRRAFDALPGPVPGHALVDGNRLPILPCSATAVVKGDARSASIAAASIVAKCDRQRRMALLHEAFPGYGWDRNDGYPTAEHYDAIRRLGVTPHHRLSFKGVLASPGTSGA